MDAARGSGAVAGAMMIVLLVLAAIVTAALVAWRASRNNPWW